MFKGLKSDLYSFKSIKNDVSISSLICGGITESGLIRALSSKILYVFLYLFGLRREETFNATLRSVLL